MDKQINFSIIICVYNGEKYIDYTIKSVINNLSEKDELIVIDDGSTDSTFEILSKYNNINIFKNLTNKGLSFSRNKGIELSKNKYIFFLDVDAEFYSDTLNVLSEIYLKYKNISAVTGQAIESNLLNDYDFFRKTFYSQNQGNAIIFNPKYLSGVCMSMNKNMLNNIKFDENLKSHAEDVDLAYKLNQNNLEYLYHPLLRVKHNRTDDFNSLAKMLFNHIFWGCYVHKKNENSQFIKYFFAGFKVLFKQIQKSMELNKIFFIFLAIIHFFVRITAVFKSVFSKIK